MMDTVFLISEVERANFLRYFMHCFGSTYICLWSYLPHPPSNYLFFWDGCYNEENINQPSSSAGSVARILFDQYRRERFFAVNDRVPGIAFRNGIPFIELKESELRRSASTDAQRQFYQEARIKTAVFMGCKSGEIELGWSNVTDHQFNIENEMRNWFPEDFCRRTPLRELSQAVDPNKASSSSSSLRSVSMDSPEISSLIFTIPSSSHIPEVHGEVPSLLPPILPSASSTSPFQQALQLMQPMPNPTSCSTILQQVLQSLQQKPNPTSPQLQLPIQPSQSSTGLLQEALQPLQSIQSSSSPHQQAMQAFALERNVQLPTPESEDAVMTRAILAVLASPSSTSSSSSSSHSLLPHMYHVSQGASAFKNYRSPLAPTTQTRASLHRQSMLKRVITYYNSLNIARREHMMAGRPTSTQLHHMISERKRREKINESFQALRSLLPQEAKKDKASVLTRTRDYLSSLKDQVEELSRKNQQLEAQLSKAAVEQVRDIFSANERLDVRVAHISESTSEQRIIDLQVTLRGESSLLDMVIIRILEFLKQITNVRLISIEAGTHTAESTSFNRMILRLNIEGNDWDESSFQEAVKRVVEDLAH